MKPSIEMLRRLFICDAVTGRLVWKARTPDMFDGPRSLWRCLKWNGRYAGKDAGHCLPKGYRCVRIFNRSYLEHHVIWAVVHGEWPIALDHRFGVERGNGISNLRRATQAQNMQNTKKRRDNKSGFKGVSWDSVNEKWVVRIRMLGGGKYQNIGRFDDPSVAHDAYCRRAVELYGEFARFE